MAFSAHMVVEVVRLLEDAGIPVWVDGGWAIDALLNRQTRDHRDLDLIISHDNVTAAESILAGMGLSRDLNLTVLPVRVVLRAAEGLQVDLHPVEFLPDGSAQFMYFDHETRNLVPFAFSADGLSGSGTIAGETVRCPTPAEQVRQKADRGFSPWIRSRIGQEGISIDLADIIALQRAFGDPSKRPETPAGDAFSDAIQRFYENHVPRLNADYVEACKELRGIKLSLSWRMTAPARWVARRLIRQFRRHDSG